MARVTRYRRCHRGSALIELVIVISFLFLILIGIIEMGLIFRDNATIAQAAREAARSGAVGSQTSVAVNRAINTATGVTLTGANITLEKSTDNGATWTALGDVGSPATANDATPGNLVRAAVVYNHSLVTSLVFSGGIKQLSAVVIMRRE